MSHSSRVCKLAYINSELLVAGNELNVLNANFSNFYNYNLWDVRFAKSWEKDLVDIYYYILKIQNRVGVFKQEGVPSNEELIRQLAEAKDDILRENGVSDVSLYESGGEWCLRKNFSINKDGTSFTAPRNPVNEGDNFFRNN